MPAYPGAGGATAPVASNLSPIALQKGESCYVFGKLAAGATQLPVNEGNVAGETLVSGAISIAVCLQPGFEGQPAPMVTVEGIFSAAPGSFEVDIQEADTEADAFYILPSAAAYTVTAVNAATQAFRVDLSPTGGKFLRVYLKTLTNAVKFTCKVTRLA
jgi:hypothetical protein